MSKRTSRYAYISGPLQAAEDLAEARELYEVVADACREASWQSYLPHQSTDPESNSEASAISVFLRDREKVTGSALLIAHVGAPSSGVGAELGIAHERGIPIVAIYRSDEQPSRFVAGMVESARYPVVVFESNDDLRSKLVSILNRPELDLR